MSVEDRKAEFGDVEIDPLEAERRRMEEAKQALLSTMDRLTPRKPTPPKEGAEPKAAPISGEARRLALERLFQRSSSPTKIFPRPASSQPADPGGTLTDQMAQNPVYTPEKASQAPGARAGHHAFLNVPAVRASPVFPGSPAYQPSNSMSAIQLNNGTAAANAERLVYKPPKMSEELGINFALPNPLHQEEIDRNMREEQKYAEAAASYGSNDIGVFDHPTTPRQVGAYSSDVQSTSTDQGPVIDVLAADADKARAHRACCTANESSWWISMLNPTTWMSGSSSE